MRKSILVKGPILSRSGYGEQARFALRALRTREDIFDIYLMNIPWGRTGHIIGHQEERKWMEERMAHTAMVVQQKGQFDMSLQITIPNEFEKIAPVNIAYTAGIETTKVPPEWIEKTNATIDRMITVGEHGKKVFENTSYTLTNNETGEQFPNFKVTVPITAVNYAVVESEASPLEIDLETEKNFLAVAQWGPRKNLDNTIRWFVDEFKDDETVGLVLKTNLAGDSIMDRHVTQTRLSALLREYKDRKCKVYLLHGEITTEQLTWLYRHPTMKALINIAHGEGFGLPMFEAAYNGLPLITVAWSGQMDFICRPNKKGKNFPRVHRVDYDLKKVQKEAVWPGVINEDSMWAFAREKSYRRALRTVIDQEERSRTEAKGLQKYIKEKFTKDNQYKQFIDAMGVASTLEKVDYVFVNDLFKEQYVGGAELSLQALMDSCPGTHAKFNSSALNTNIVDTLKDSTWVIGNIAQIPSPDILQYIIDSGIKYHFVEFDYKFCEYRNPSLYQMLEDEECEYDKTDQGALITNFVNSSIQTHFMSEEQRSVYKTSLPDLDETKTTVLSSIFDDQFFQQIQTLRSNSPEKTGPHVVLGSRSWVKGFAESEKWCKENNVEYEVISNLPHSEVLNRLAVSKGIVFKPTGLDTCPRYVIEAKLLGCTLEVNENVQHLNEEWFNTDDLDSIVTYLSSRREVFWNSVTGNE
jgi:glycosyltransferase involved in cell wall biosynthesis